MPNESDRAAAPAEFCDHVLAARGLAARSRRLARRATPAGSALAEAFLAAAHTRMRVDPRDASEAARLALRVAESAGDREAMLRACSAWAQAESSGGDHRAALRAVRRGAVHLHADEHAHAAELETLRAQALLHLERYGPARDAVERARRSHAERGDRKGLLWTSLVLGDIAYREDDPRAALRHLADADRLLNGSPLPRVRGAIAANRANALEACNRFRGAERQFVIARDLFAREGCTHTVAQIDYNAAYAEGLRGRFASALRRYADVEHALEALGDERHLAHVDLDRAEIHVQLNMPAEAALAASRAERRFRALGLAKEATQACQIAARAAAQDGDAKKAHALWERAARRFAKAGHGERAYQCLAGRAELLRAAGDRAGARRMAARAERAHPRGRQNPLSLASVALLRGWLELDEGRASAARGRAEEVLAHCRRVHAPCVRIEAERLLGRALRELGDVSSAIDAYRRAIDELERYRGGVPVDEYMMAFLAGRRALYEEIVELLADAGREHDAFEFVERAKSRALTDLLQGRESGGAGQGEGTLAARAQHLRERLTAIYGRIMRQGEGGAARSSRATQRALREARSLEVELADVLRQRRMSGGGTYALESAAAPTLAETRAELDGRTCLVEFFLTGTSLFTFAITRDALHVTRRAVRAREVLDLLEQFHFHLAKHERPEMPAPELVLRATRATLGKLAALALGDIAPHLTSERLVIVPHGALHHVPFHALPWGDGWLCDRFEITYAPSAAVYRHCGAPRARATGAPAILALPDEVAPAIADEAVALGARLGTDRVHVGPAATFHRLAQEVGRARIVHLATHGMFRHAQPMLSSVRLADRWANLYDLYELDVRSELIVLSTCESGIADVAGGDEILGLTRGFLYAGAPAILASQWRVDDAVTTSFMTRFYAEFERLGDAAAAHRATMVAVRERHPHPYYWAPFFLTGRPGTESQGSRGAARRQGCRHDRAGAATGRRGRKEHAR